MARAFRDTFGYGKGTLKYFKYIFRLNFLQALTAEGKEILYFEEQIGKQ